MRPPLATQLAVLLADPASTFKCDMCKNFERPLMRGKEPWRRLRLLGSLLDDAEDARNRMQRHSSSIPRFGLGNTFFSVATRIRIYNAYVLHVLGIFWPDQISNDELYSRTASIPISRLAKEKRWSLLGHVLRLPRDTPAFVAMQSFLRAAGLFPHRRGRPRTCLASVLTQDLLDSFEKHHCLLQTLSDLEGLRQKAQNRQAWTRLTRAVVG